MYCRTVFNLLQPRWSTLWLTPMTSRTRCIVTCLIFEANFTWAAFSLPRLGKNWWLLTFLQPGIVITSYFLNMKSCIMPLGAGRARWSRLFLRNWTRRWKTWSLSRFSPSLNSKVEVAVWSDAQLLRQVDVDDLEEVAAEYKITAMPTFIFIKKSEQVSLGRY